MPPRQRWVIFHNYRGLWGAIRAAALHVSYEIDATSAVCSPTRPRREPVRQNRRRSHSALARAATAIAPVVEALEPRQLMTVFANGID